MNQTHLALACSLALAATYQAQAQYWTTPATVTLPSIPSSTYKITSYGASTGSANNATAIQNAINAASSAGGGTVQVPSGTFLSGPITMKSKVNLNLASGSTLKMLAYGTWPGTTVFISGSSLTDVELSGSGTIDGQGAAWWAAFAAGTISKRPQEVSLGNSTRVAITGIKLINSPEEHIWVKGDTDLTVTGITISTTASNAKNTDGVDINATHAYIANNNIADGDDNLVLEGSYIDVESCTFGVGHGCSIGSITTSGVSFVTVHGCSFSGTEYGFRLKSDRGNGGTVQYIAYNNNTMSSVATPILITSWYPTDPSDPETVSSGTVNSTTPIWKHIKFQTLTATGATSAGTLYGLPEEYVNDVTFDNVKLSAKTGMDIYYASAIVFQNGSSVTVSSGNAVTIWDATVTGITTHTY